MLILGAVFRHMDRGTLQQLPSHSYTHTHTDCGQGKVVAEAQREPSKSPHLCGVTCACRLSIPKGNVPLKHLYKSFSRKTNVRWEKKHLINNARLRQRR